MAGNGIIKGGNLAFQRVKLVGRFLRDTFGMPVQKVPVLAALAVRFSRNS